MTPISPHNADELKQAYDAFERGELKLSERHLDGFLKQLPNYPDARFLKALIRYSSQAPDQAIELVEGLLSDPLVDLNQALKIKCLRLHGAANQKKQLWSPAIESFEKVLKVAGDSLEAWIDLAQCHLASGNALQCKSCLEKAALLEEAKTSARFSCAQAELCWKTWSVPESAAFLLESVKRTPTNLDLVSQYLYTLNFLDEAEDIAAQQHIAPGHALGSKLPKDGGAPCRKTQRKAFRIGFISPDLKKHSVAYFLLPLLRALKNESAVHTFCFALHCEFDEVSEAICNHCDQFIPVSSTDLFEKIEAANLDVLVDLAGHTSGNAMPFLLTQASKLQIPLVTWLGYPNTTGFPQFDYRIVDSLTDPVATVAEQMVETPIYLPNGFLCYEPPAQIPEVGPLPWIKNGFLTFGCFNNINKLTNTQIAHWAALMDEIPKSRLILKSTSFGDVTVRNAVESAFKAHGILSERLILKGRIESTSGHLELYNSVDIALDTHPYNGTTTTFESLLMGCPVVSKWGKAHRARVSASIMTRLGLIDWIHESSASSVAFIKQQDKPTLAELRSSLRERLITSTLCDAECFSKAFLEQLAGKI